MDKMLDEMYGSEEEANKFDRDILDSAIPKP